MANGLMDYMYVVNCIYQDNNCIDRTLEMTSDVPTNAGCTLRQTVHVCVANKTQQIKSSNSLKCHLAFMIYDVT